MMELMKKRKRLTESEARYYMVQIVDAVKYMHSEKVRCIMEYLTLQGHSPRLETRKLVPEQHASENRGFWIGGKN